MKTKLKKKVFVGLSGGVDSSVSAALLKEATPKNFKKLFGRPTPKGFRGYDVAGVFIKVWQPFDEAQGKPLTPCTWREERRDAMRVCAKLDIPFLTFDFEKIYKKEVADYMIAEYKAGRTPNPDVMCNKEVKFGAFFKKALSMGAEYIATGHYARLQLARRKSKVLKGKKLYKLDEHYKLLTACDSTKDQSYFLWTLKQDQLKHILFPVGHLKKSQVRKLAKKYGLHTFKKKDSQGICFLGKLDMKEFLQHFIKPKSGRVLDINSKTIGKHNGATFFTLGERHGFTITKKTNHDRPYYIIAKDIKKNTITVSQNLSGDIEEPVSMSRPVLDIEDTNWISRFPKNYNLKAKTYSCQVRYHGEFLPCKIEIKFGNKARVIFSPGLPRQSFQVAAGQSIVIYDKDICLGGGVVK